MRKSTAAVIIANTIAFAFFALVMCRATEQYAATPLPGHIEKPSNVARWTHADRVRFPNCRNIDSRPADVIPNEVVLVPLNGGKPYREQFGTAWAERKSGQFFVIGYCR